MTFLKHGIESAILKGDLFIYINSEKINLPNRQTSGTITQKRAYASLQAQNIIKNLKP